MTTLLSEAQIYEKVAKQEMSVQEATSLLAALNQQTTAASFTVTTEVVTTADSSQLQKAVETQLAQWISELLDLPATDIDSDENFMDLGVDSTQLVQLTGKFEQAFHIELYPTLLFEYQNLRTLAEYLSNEYGESLRHQLGFQITPPAQISKPTQPSRINGGQAPIYTQAQPVAQPTPDPAVRQADIAIVGMAGIYADSPNLQAFWQHLAAQTDLISEIPAHHFDYRPWFDPDAQPTENKTYCKWGSFIDSVAQFDAGFFNISPREAEVMDPQLRLLLQVLYTAGEDAGYAARLKGSKTGMYVGVCSHSYADEMARVGKPLTPHDGTGNAATMIANRPSFYFNLTGPSLAIDTACSSSLVALHLACQALRNNECDMAFAAGTNLLLCSWHYRYYSSLRALSRSGRCHTFDQRADGYVPGEGVGALLLKPLAKALADGDRIHAVIKGSAVNHGGYTPSITAPSVNQEAQVMMDAWDNAQIDPATLSYIEAHGTGTELGDPVEINAIKKAFKKYPSSSAQKQFCAIGSAKAHIGHTEAAAGITGVIKVVLSMQHQHIPAMPQFEQLNPYIQIDDSPLYINRQTIAWQPPPGIPRRAGVSSYGFGGAYAHVVLEEYNAPAPVAAPSGQVQLIPLSAKTPERLVMQAQNLLAYLVGFNVGWADNGSPSVAATVEGATDGLPASAHPTKAHPTKAHLTNLAEIAYTLQVGREAMRERLVLMAANVEELQTQLNQFIQGQAVGYRGQVNKQQSNTDLLVAGRAGQAFMAILLEDRELTKLAQLWVSGVDIAWQLLHSEPRPRLISLPMYPFENTAYWFTDSHTAQAQPNVGWADAGSPSIAAPQTQPPTTTDMLNQTQQLFADLLKVPATAVNVSHSLLELGADSVILLQAVQRIEEQFGVTINVRQLFETLNTVQAIADHLATVVEPTAIVPMPSVAPPAVPVVTAPPVAPEPSPTLSTAKAWSMGNEPPVAEELTPQQQQHLTDLIQRYTARTAGSKAQEQHYRPVFADMRTAVGFRLETKEMCYPLIAHRSQGAYVWDVDGQQYIDLTMGFGVALFGYQPAFVTEAIQAQLKLGFQVGPQSETAGEVARLISELTGMQRVTFCNSGTEAVMTAVRVARAATRRKKIVIFSGSYHGHFDGTMALAGLSGHGSSPMAVGVLPEMVQEVMVLSYGSEAALQTIQAHAHELAAVLVEPVQSRKPDLQPKAFLQQLRTMTEAAGTVLIFDEMITGFRIHPGGAQAWFGIQADLATYGKVLGGGLPIGVVAGREDIMARIDGGVWHYGDQSYPAVERTFYAGTFCKHPLAMATTLAVLQHLQREGAALQQQLNQRTAELAARLNQFFAARTVPIRVVYFGSLFRFALTGNFSYVYQPLAMDLFFYHLISRGIYVWELRTCFLSTAHSEADISALEHAVQDSIMALQAGGFFVDKNTPALSDSTANNSITTDSASDPLSPAQQQLWVLNQLDPAGSRAYHLHLALQLNGQLQVDALQQALTQLVDRHEALRMAITADGQQVLQPQPLQLVPRKVPAETDLNHWLQQHTLQDFALDQAPLMRVYLLQFAVDRHVLALAMHHIMIDGWSSGVLVQELLQLYHAQIKAVPAQLPAALQWRDYLTWQANHLHTESMQQQKAYWLQQLQGVDWELALPFDRPRPATRSYRAARYSQRLTAALSQSVRQLAQQQGCTLFMTLLAVYNVLLHRLSGQDRFIIGIMAAGRALPQSEHLVGYCSHILPIVSQLPAEATFADYLQQLKTTLLAAYQHQDYPFAELLEQLDNRRDLQHAPLIKTLFNLERPIELPTVPDLTVQVLDHPISYDEFDFGLNVTDLGQQLLLDFDYNTDLFNADSVQRVIERFSLLLSAILDAPDSRCTQLPLLSDSERQQVLVEWNTTRRDMPTHSLQHLFATQAAATPDAIALRCGAEKLSYRQLDQQSNQLAHYLHQHGIATGQIVGLCMSRSLETVIGLLGILKTGAAYLPLDVSFPTARLGFMLAEAEVPAIVLSSPQQRDKLPQIAVDYVCLQSLQTTLAAQPTTALELTSSPNDLAYVLYTSGSTGKPKGVMVKQSNLVNYLCWCAQTCELDVGETSLVHSSLAFDLAITGLLPPLIAGACVTLLPDEADMDAFAAAVASGQYRLIKLTPSHLQALNQLIDISDATTRVKTLVIGGEPLQRELITGWQHTRIINHYGPTEATVGCCTHEVDRNEQGLIPIGRPIANTQLYSLDPQLQPTPIGSTGELYIGGAGVAAGYLQRPELTAERFIANPFAAGRLYKTGDLVRYRADGQIEFMGRCDDQVKLRGFRIELHEIEAVLRQHPSVQDSLVILRNDDGDPQLVAYLILQPPQEQVPAELKPLLAKHLPDYMQPSAYVILQAFPLNANRKIDRRALPAPEKPVTNETFVAPRTALETALSEIWRKVLQHDSIGIHDNFFDLGGHSLKATQVVSRIQQRLAKKLSLKALLETPTIAALAQRLEQQADDTLPQIEPVPTQPHYPLSSAQKRLWAVDDLNDHATAYNMVGGVLLTGAFDVAALKNAFVEVVKRHESLRTSFALQQGEPRQTIHADVAFQVEELECSTATDGIATAQAYLQAELDHYFDLAVAPLLKVKLLKLAADAQQRPRHVLLVNMHHIISDGWSLVVLVKDLLHYYQGLPALDPLPIQYKDYAHWQTRLLESADWVAHQRYWQTQLGGELPQLNLPTDFPRPAVQTHNGAMQQWLLPPATQSALHQLARQQEMSLFMVLHSLFNSLLHCWTQQEEFIVGAVVAGRHHAYLEPQIGFYVNMLPLRVKVAATDSLTQVLQHVKHVVTEAYAHQDYPFDALIESLHLSRNRSRHPLFDVMINVRNNEPLQFALPGVAVSPLTDHSTTSKCDLEIMFRESEAGIQTWLEYNTDLFKAETIQQFAEDFQALTAQVLDNPQYSLSELKQALKGTVAQEEQAEFLAAAMAVDEDF